MEDMTKDHCQADINAAKSQLISSPGGGTTPYKQKSAVINPRITNEGRVILKDVVPVKTPFTIDFYTGDICNIKCNYCEHSLPVEKISNKYRVREFLKWDVFTRAANQITEFPDKVKIINFCSMGEPLLHKRLPDMIRVLKDLDVANRIEVTTNGIALTPELSLKLAESGLDGINISIQGTSKEKYKEVCGVGIDFEKFIDNIRFLYQNKGNCRIFIKTLDTCLDGKEDEERFYTIFGDICDAMHINTTRRLFPDVDYTGLVRDENVSIYGNKSIPHEVCSHTFYALIVSPDGTLLPCCVPSTPTDFGNVNTTSLIDAFQGEARKSFLLLQLNGKRRDHPFCGKCTAPDDQCFENDNLDPYVEEILPRFK